MACGPIHYEEHKPDDYGTSFPFFPWRESSLAFVFIESVILLKNLTKHWRQNWGHDAVKYPTYNEITKDKVRKKLQSKPLVEKQKQENDQGIQRNMIYSKNFNDRVDGFLVNLHEVQTEKKSSSSWQLWSFLISDTKIVIRNSSTGGYMIGPYFQILFFFLLRLVHINGTEYMIR